MTQGKGKTSFHEKKKFFPSPAPHPFSRKAAILIKNFVFLHTQNGTFASVDASVFAQGYAETSRESRKAFCGEYGAEVYYVHDRRRTEPQGARLTARRRRRFDAISTLETTIHYQSRYFIWRSFTFPVNGLQSKVARNLT